MKIAVFQLNVTKKEKKMITQFLHLNSKYISFFTRCRFIDHLPEERKVQYEMYVSSINLSVITGVMVIED